MVLTTGYYHFAQVVKQARTADNWIFSRFKYYHERETAFDSIN